MKSRIALTLIAILLIISATACGSSVSKTVSGTQTMGNPNQDIDYSQSELRDIYLAGGCFWGVEAFFSQVRGVAEATSGYANGNGEDPSYEDVIKGEQGFAETVHVKYDPERIELKKLLEYFFRVIDPTSVNRQGFDNGIQYRSGIYYTDESDLNVINSVVAEVQMKYEQEIVTEVEPLTNFYLAEEYHQNYLDKNPDGYCHIDLSILDEINALN